MPFMIAQGGCRGGADMHARNWANHNGMCCVTFHAAWFKFGTQAGPIRNQQMLAHFKPDTLYAFPGGRGTQSCVDTARALNISVMEIDR